MSLSCLCLLEEKGVGADIADDDVLLHGIQAPCADGAEITKGELPYSMVHQGPVGPPEPNYPVGPGGVQFKPGPGAGSGSELES